MLSYVCASAMLTYAVSIKGSVKPFGKHMADIFFINHRLMIT
ncbi:hypothetical protein C4K04_1288 [Pseudomonas chlororaphis]|uniref:Uncharacterized protein n=1 Tax=Pseudomonas chlororaphis TaxID=587753 RepID=A0A3G7TJ08_9PSED|nr:hypothetical protein C4K04_1288 [Pseudomonas chlororaphis]